MKKYFTHKETGTQYTAYCKIANGILLTKFHKDTGVPYANKEYQVFVTEETLKTDYEAFDFKINTTLEMNSIVAKYAELIMRETEQYGGVDERNVNNLFEFFHSSPNTLDLFRDMVKKDNVEISDYDSNNEDDYYYAEAEEVLPFVQKGLIPLLKKMLIEFQESVK